MLSEPLLQAISNSLHDMLVRFDRELSYNGTVIYLIIYHARGSIKKNQSVVNLPIENTSAASLDPWGYRTGTEKLRTKKHRQCQTIFRVLKFLDGAERFHSEPTPEMLQQNFSTRSPFVTLLSRHSFGKQAWFTESHIILIISFFLFVVLFTPFILDIK